MAKQSDVRIDKDSLDHLESVRQGRSRWFVMSCKGTSILSLVVYQKGSIEKYKKQAKEVGPGQLYHGLIEGKGPDISFKLSTADGFDKEPVKPIVLKAFLEEHADYKAKPVFEVVPTIESPTDDAATPPPSPPPPTSTTTSTATGTDDKARFTNRLKELKPTLDQIVSGATDAAQQAKEQASVAAGLARSGDFAAANQALDQLEALLGNAGPSTTTTSTSTTTNEDSPVPIPPPPPSLPPNRKAQAGLRRLASTITQALRAYPEREAEIKKLKADVEKLIAESKVSEADTALQKLEKLLSTLGSVSPDKADAFHDQWEEAVDTWDAAVATVKEQLAGLQTYLVRDADEDLQSIGEFGLGAVTQKHLVPLSAALMELDATGPEQLKTAAKRVQNLVGAFRQHVETSPMVKACDENPFGVTVAIRQTLAPGFAALEAGLNGVLSA